MTTYTPIEEPKKIKHLIDGCNLAILNGPEITMSIGKDCKEWNGDFTTKMYEVLKHYEDGGTLAKRP